MSSKLYKRYISLKIEDPKAFYLFKSGIFYIFISDDARLMAPALDLKLANLNPYIKKCGFPVSSSEKYFKKIKDLQINVKIIDLTDMTFDTNLDKYLNAQQIFAIIDEFLKIDVDNLSISQAFDVLKNFQNKFEKFNNNTF